MYVLKKVKGETLIETLVATIILLVVFGFSMALLLSVVKNTLTDSSGELRFYLYKKCYLYRHEKIEIPYSETFEKFTIEGFSSGNQVIFQAVFLENINHVEKVCLEKNRIK